MSRWSFFLCAAAIALAIANPAHADFQVIRWSSGDCKIWNNDNNTMPNGDGWIVLAWGLANYESAWSALNTEISRGQCRW